MAVAFAALRFFELNYQGLKEAYPSSQGSAHRHHAFQIFAFDCEIEPIALRVSTIHRAHLPSS